MDTIQLVLFEGPFWLGICSFVLFATILLARRRMPDAAARRALPITMLVIALLFAVQTMVTTDRERIALVLADVIRAAEHQNMSAMRRTISPNYDCDRLNQTEVLAQIEAILGVVGIRDTRIQRLETVFDGDRAETVLAARATIDIRGGIGEFHWGRWRISWSREPDGWRITALRPEAIDNIPVRGMGELSNWLP